MAEAIIGASFGRPKPAARPAGPTNVELVVPEAFSTIDHAWRDLLENAVEPNVCYAPDFVAHLMDPSAGAVRGGAIAIRGQGALAGALIGLWPVRFAPWRVPGLSRSIVALHSPFSASSAPLLRKGYETEALKSLLHWLAQRGGPLGAFHINELRLDGSVWRHLRPLLERRGQPWLLLRDLERPIIDTQSAPTADAYVARLKGKTRQTLKRKWRRLASEGDLAYTAHMGAELPEAMAEFLELERAGWKGAAGTAMAQSERDRRLAETVMTGPGFGATRIEALRLDGRPVAMSIHIGRGDSALHFKPAYDERYSRHSPGQLLHLKTIEGMYRDGWAVALDSAVDPDNQLGTIWRERRPIGRLLIATSPNGSPAALAVAGRAIRAFDGARGTASRIVRSLRRPANRGSG